jgi:hypothetical protein
VRRAEIRNATLRDNARASKSNRCHVNCDLSVTASDRCSHVVICCDHILLLVVAGRCWSLLVVSRFGLVCHRRRLRLQVLPRWSTMIDTRRSLGRCQCPQNQRSRFSLGPALRAWISVEMVCPDMIGPFDSLGLQLLPRTLKAVLDACALRADLHVLS